MLQDLPDCPVLLSLKQLSDKTGLPYLFLRKMIVEEEQNGEQRAEYGKAILKELSKRLTESLGKGFSVENHLLKVY